MLHVQRYSKNLNKTETKFVCNDDKEKSLWLKGTDTSDLKDTHATRHSTWRKLRETWLTSVNLVFTERRICCLNLQTWNMVLTNILISCGHVKT